MASPLDRLNGWQRIGVVLSVIWALYGITLVDREDARARESATRAYATCMQANVVDREWNRKSDALAQQPCLTLLPKDSHIEEDDWLNFFLFSILPIPIAWFGVYKGIALLKWVKAGFELGRNP